MSKRLYHICYTSHQEVLCRNFRDYSMMFNCIAQAVFNTGSNLLAHSIMSTHVHLICESGDASGLVKRIRSSYTQMFNHRYRRAGRLGEESFFCDRLEGRHHITAAISYVMRNPWHHEVCANPYAYPFSSIGQYFKNSLDRFLPMAGSDIRKNSKSDIIRDKNIIPGHIKVSLSSGMIRVCDVIDSIMVEGYFGSYRAFIYGLSRNDYEKWEKEQCSDNVAAMPVTIRTVEPFLSEDKVVAIMRQNPHWLKEKRITDIELCDIIDHSYIPRLGKSGYAELTEKEIYSIRRHLFKSLSMKVSSNQLDRCLPCHSSRGGK